MMPPTAVIASFANLFSVCACAWASVPFAASWTVPLELPPNGVSPFKYIVLLDGTCARACDKLARRILGDFHSFVSVHRTSDGSMFVNPCTDKLAPR